MTVSGADAACGRAWSARTVDTMAVASSTKPQPVGGSARRTVSMRRCRAGGREAGDRDAHQWNVQPEYHAPTRCVGEQATEQRADTEAQHQGPAPGTDRYGSALRCRAGADCGERAGDREGGRETLQRPPRQQRSLAARQGDHAGRDTEQCQASHRYQACAEQVRRLAAQHNAGCRHDQVGVDRPLSANRAEAEFSSHGRQRGHDRSAVDADPKHGQARCQQHHHGSAAACGMTHEVRCRGTSASV